MKLGSYKNKCFVHSIEMISSKTDIFNLNVSSRMVVSLGTLKLIELPCFMSVKRSLSLVFLSLQS